MSRRIVPAALAVVAAAVSVALWMYSRTTTTVTETFPTTPTIDGFSVTYDSLHVAGGWMALSVVAAAVAVYLVLRSAR